MALEIKFLRGFVCVPQNPRNQLIVRPPSLHDTIRKRDLVYRLPPPRFSLTSYMKPVKRLSTFILYCLFEGRMTKTKK